MTDPVASSPGELIIRAPASSELPRVLHLFRNTRLRPECRLLAAERTLPITRFVGAAAWWPEGHLARFQLACQPGRMDVEAMAGLIQAVTAAGREAGLEGVQYADLLPDESPWVAVLQGQSFERLRSERFFEIAYRNAWERTMRLYEKHRSEIPVGWRTDEIRKHPPEIILPLAAPHRLLPPEELRRYWQATTAGGFDLDRSCVLFDGDRPFGTFLVRQLADTVWIDVQVVQEPNRRRRSLGDLCLLYHGVSRLPPDGPCQWLRFRSGETEHRQTANIALRMGGRELPRRHVYGRPLR